MMQEGMHQADDWKEKKKKLLWYVFFPFLKYWPEKGFLGTSKILFLYLDAGYKFILKKFIELYI